MEGFKNVCIKAIVAALVYVGLSLIAEKYWKKEKITKDKVESRLLTGTVMGLGSILKFGIFSALPFDLI